MPHIGGQEGQKREHRHSGEAVPEHIARGAMAAPKIDGQDDGDRQRSRDAGKPRHQHAEPAIRAVIGEKARAVADHFEERGHGIAGQFGRVGRAFGQWGDDIHRSISRVGWSRFGTEITGTVASWSAERGLWFNPMGGVLLSGWGVAAIAWGLALLSRGNSDVGSNGFAAGLRPGGAHLRPPALDGHGARPRARGAGNQLQGYRVGSAELAYPRHPDRQLLPQPVRTTRLVLHPDRAGAAAAPCRPRDRAVVVGVRGHSLCPCRNFRGLEQRPAAFAGVVRRRAGAVRDVAVFRAEDAFVDLSPRALLASALASPARLPVLEPKVLNDSRSAALRGHRTDRYQ